MTTRTRLFKNGLSKSPDRRYVVLAGSDGFVVVPTFFITDEKIVLSYKKLKSDISMEDEDKILSKINESILDNVAEPQVISLNWGSDVDKAMEKIAIQNRLLNHQFDSE